MSSMFAIPSTLTMIGQAVDTSPDALGELVDSSGLLDDPAGLRARMDEEGYLFLRGYLDCEQVMAARLEVCRRLAKLGQLDSRYPVIEAIHSPDELVDYQAEPLTKNNEPLRALLYSGRMIAFYEKFLGGPVSHFDYTWFRSVSPGLRTTAPHCDVVYMGRGSLNLYTSWTPIGDALIEDGPLCVMPGSHRIRKLRDNYCRTDVDAVCTNRRQDDGRRALQNSAGGSLGTNPPRMRRALGLPFLTTNFRAGDLLVFSIFTIHCGLDNHGRRVRLSSDSRYQPAGEPVDHRWITIDGKPPVTHGENSRRELIC